MTNKTTKNIRLCCSIAMVMIGLWTIAMGIHLGELALCDKIDWHQNSLVKILVYVSSIVSTLCTIGLCTAAIINIFKGVRINTVFPKSNVKLLFWLTLADFCYRLCLSNLFVLYGETQFTLSSANFIMPFALLFFAFMYKVAADAVEENNLTV